MYKFDSSPVHVYFDLNYINNDQTGLSNPTQLRFSQTRTTPYLQDPSKYFASLVRFQMDTTTLPIFIPQIKLGELYPNKTIYSFTMTYPVGLNIVASSQAFMWYFPEDQTATLPNTPPAGTIGITQQDMSGTYYFVYTFQYLCNLINQTLSNAFQSLQQNTNQAGGTLPTNHCPYFEWDTSSNTFSLFCDQTGFNQNPPYTPIKIYCNSAMYRLINSMPFQYFGNNPNGQNYLLRVFNDNNSNLALSSSYTQIVMYQDITSVSLINPIQSIVFASSTLPIASTLVSASTAFGSNTVSTGDSNNILSIITDFEVPVSPNNLYVPQVDYIPSNEFRLFDITSNQPLTNIDILVYWKDRFNNMYPLFLESNGATANLKLLFRRKDFYLK